ncbi:diguanylate cyclase [Sphingomonas sp. 3-13AW]|uniref:sensor domain-containing diguanylate cyclase n=1 Tax=Sphingomonas sp. 3-13AW TaxID=3050450 RepID=UPI003BB5CD02
MKRLVSLSARIYAVMALSVMGTLSLGALLLASSYHSREAFQWVGHSQRVIISLNSLVSNLGEAESGLRGYLMTDDPTYLRRFDGNLAQAHNVRETIVELVRDNPRQLKRAQRLRTLAAEKAEIMGAVVQRGRRVGAMKAVNPATREHGRSLMEQISALTAEMRDDERQLLLERTANADASYKIVRVLVIVGCALLTLLIGLLAWQLRNGMTRPLADLLEAVKRFGSGDHEARATVAGSAEFRNLAVAHNVMAEQLESAIAQSNMAEAKLARANAELTDRSRALEARQTSVELLSGMARRLQAIRDEGELTTVLDCFLPQMLPDLAGALYVLNHSHNLLVRISAWGEPYSKPEMFLPDQCWALRRGQSHAVDRPGADIVCAHAAGEVPVERLCEPVIAGGEVLGLIYVEGLSDPEDRFRLTLLMENVALALVNENLRSRLREQSIRDPLTKLFNRRYLEEALQIEAARAQRGGTPLAVVMADIDHFKRFNDTHGHEAGDALLREVAGQIQSHFRHGDIVCRYGGEEFTVIAPGASLELICRRADELRRLVRELTIDFRGQRLGPVTMSFGIDVWIAADERSPDTLIGEADRALFRAKRLGRDRIEVVPPREEEAAE